tara:strand:+ start:418 stop:993 length:576 start_codon:yes stop_codon:yes gene_type:complete
MKYNIKHKDLEINVTKSNNRITLTSDKSVKPLVITDSKSKETTSFLKFLMAYNGKATPFKTIHDDYREIRGKGFDSNISLALKYLDILNDRIIRLDSCDEKTIILLRYCTKLVKEKVISSKNTIEEEPQKEEKVTTTTTQINKPTITAGTSISVNNGVKEGVFMETNVYKTLLEKSRQYDKLKETLLVGHF